MIHDDTLSVWLSRDRFDNEPDLLVRKPLRNLDEEYIELTNKGSSSVDMTGWTLSDGANHAYNFPSGFTLEPGDSVTIYTGSGSDSDSQLYWDSRSVVWNNTGDR